MSLIELSGVSKSYQKGDEKVLALSDINMEIEEGEFVVLTGRSGSGKSTLLSILSGLNPPSTGKIRIRGTSIYNLNQENLVSFRNDNLGIIFQDFHLIDYLNVVENITIPLLIGNKAIENQLLQNILNKLQIDHRKSYLPDQLSGGEKQRVGIARAIIHDPPIIIADEPTGKLDHVMATRIVDYLLKIQTGKLFNGESSTKKPKTVVMVTHDKSLIRPGMRMIEIQNGKITG